jgi:integrase/recombinase XerD
MEEEGITGTNAARRLRPTKEDLSEFKAATEQDIRALVADCSNHTRDDFRDRAIILFMRSTGCRVRGLVNLRLSDLDVADQSASVIEKGNKRRTVFMDSDTLRALHDWMEVRPATDQDWLFVALGRRFHGNKLTSSALRQMFRRRARNASISGHTNPHSLRQAYARRYLKNGGDVGILSSLMGHADVTTTMHYYGRLNQDELKEQYRRFAIDDTDRAANESMSDDKLD